MAKLKVHFTNETNVSISKHHLEESLKLILRRLNRLDRVDIELLVVEDSRIKQLNSKFRSTNSTTDVLSFPNSTTSDKKDEILGSIVVSVDTAQRQAKQAGVTLDKEIQALSGHGLLHLLDFHHR